MAAKTSKRRLLLLVGALLAAGACEKEPVAAPDAGTEEVEPDAGRSALERPGVLERSPADGRLPKDLWPPSAP